MGGRPLCWVPGSALTNKLLGRQRHKDHVRKKVTVELALGGLQQGAREDWWMHAEAMEILHVLCRDPKHRPDVEAERGLVPLMMKAATDHQDQIEVSEMLVACASEMCQMDTHRSSFASKGCEKFIISSCVKYNGKDPAVRSICPIEEHGAVAFWHIQDAKKAAAISLKHMEQSSTFLLP